jgi:hypothetical protein
MGGKLDRLKLVLCAVNGGAYGTDAAPGSADAVKGFEFNVTPLQSTRVDDDQVQPWLGAGDSYLVGKHAEITFKVRASGAGAAGDVPPVGSLLRICGLSETVSAGVSVDYEPVSSGFEDGTLYFWRDNKRRVLTGVRGTVTFMAERSSVPYFEFALRGLYNKPTNVAFPTPDFSAWVKPVVAEPVNVGTWSFFGTQPIFNSLRLSFANDYPFVSRVNQERVDITGRAAEGELVMEEEDLATLDLEDLATSHTNGTLSFEHGKTAGNIVGVSAPKVQVMAPSEGESEGTAMQTAPLSLKPDAGNDELKITFK